MDKRKGQWLISYFIKSTEYDLRSHDFLRCTKQSHDHDLKSKQCSMAEKTRSQGKYNSIKSKKQPLCAKTLYSCYKLVLFLYALCYLVSIYYLIYLDFKETTNSHRTSFVYILQYCTVTNNFKGGLIIITCLIGDIL